MKNQSLFFSRNVFVALPFLLCVVLGASAFSQSFTFTVPRFADGAALSVPKNTLKSVNKNFYASFSGGDWYYRGAEASAGGVSAYIQIPQKLDMAPAMQQQYLQQAICPKKDKVELWNKLKHLNLSVHIYTYSKEQSVSAQCDNPWQANQA